MKADRELDIDGDGIALTPSECERQQRIRGEQPTYAYMRDARGRCWAVCAFKERPDSDIIDYAWSVCSTRDRYSKRIGKEIAVGRLQKYAFMFFGGYDGAYGKHQVIMLIQRALLNKGGTERSVAFRAKLKQVREQFAHYSSPDQLVPPYEA